MTTGFFDVFQSFLTGTTKSPDKRNGLTLPTSTDNTSDGVNAIFSSDLLDTLNMQDVEKNILQNNNLASILKSSASKNSFLTFNIKSGKMDSENVSLISDVLSLDKTPEKSVFYIGSNVEVEPELEEALISGSHICSEDDQNSHEAIFIPFRTSDNCFNVPQETVEESFKVENESCKLSVPSHTLKKKVKRHKRFSYGPVIKNISRRKRSKCAVKNKKQLHMSREKPKVIVERSPSVGICLSDISALKLKDSDCESDGGDVSDENNNSKANHSLAMPSEPYIKTEILDDYEDILELNCVPHNFERSPPHLSNNESSASVLSDASILYQDVSNSGSAESQTTYIASSGSEKFPDINKLPTSGACSDTTNVQESYILPTFENEILANSSISNNENHDSDNSICHVELQTACSSTRCSSGSVENLSLGANQIKAEQNIPLLIENEKNDLSEDRVMTTDSSSEKKMSETSESSAKVRKSSSHHSHIRIKRGKGLKLGDIHHISSAIDDLPPETFSALHHILFDISAPSTTDLSLAQARSNILNFCGFPFNASRSCAFALKRIRLKRLQYEILCDLSQFLIGEQFKKRKEMEEKILHFLMCPTASASDVTQPRKRQRKMWDEAEYALLKESILQNKGPVPYVKIKKLSEEDIVKYALITSKVSEADSSSCTHSNSTTDVEDSAAILEKNHQYTTYLSHLIENSCKAKSQHNETDSMVNMGKTELRNIYADKVAAVVPAVRQPYVLKGLGKMLKSFPDVANKVNTAEKRIIHLMHVLLFGVRSEIEKSKSNILEFSGFPECQTQLLQQRRRFLEMILTSELEKICKILNLYYNAADRCHSIDILLEFLQEPSEKLMQNGFELFSALQCDKPHGKPLKSFDDIRFNIECATPEDLNELHDILFLKPCDSFEIHQRVLDFSGFSFDVNSSEYQCRKTLMCYMSFASIQKISKLLGLMTLHPHSHKEDLAICILKFLMEPKVPVNGASCGNTTNKKAHIVMLRTASTDNPCAFASSDSLPCSSSSASQMISVQSHSQETDLRPASLHSLNHSNTADSHQHQPVHNENRLTLCGDRQVPSVISNIVHPPSTSFTEDINSSSEDEVESTVPLVAFVSHPCDSQLKNDIQEVIYNNLHRLTMNGLVNSVLAKYPQFDLCYRKKFIKSKARKVLSRMRLPLQHVPHAESTESIRPFSVPPMHISESHNHSQFVAYQPSETASSSNA